MKRSDSLDPIYRAIREGPREDLGAFSAGPGLAAVLDHFAEIADARQGWKVLYPLREVLFLVVCGTIATFLAAPELLICNSINQSVSQWRMLMHRRARRSAGGALAYL